MNYDEFIIKKTKRCESFGFEPFPILAPAFDWQAHVIKWAVRKGRAALFESPGLGKTLQQLEWARQVVAKTGGKVLILTPLSVARQTADEAAKFGIHAVVIEEPEDIAGPDIYITNYDKLEKFAAIEFIGVVLDESSILKNFTGKTRIALTERFKDTPYRLCCTATPSPNDYTEFGQHAEFLGICTSAQMLATFFINDTFNTGDWRLKKHADQQFWEWLASWAACINLPSDIGYEDTGYILPPLNLRTEIVQVDETIEKGEELFRHATLSATTMHKEMRLTASARVAKVAEEVNASTECWIVWCNTNDESAQLAAAIPDAVEVKGSDTGKFKDKASYDFSHGKIRVLLSKSSIFGYGLNFQHCHNVAFVGLSYSFEDFYQALRRTYRFGQTKEVNAVIVQAATEGAIMQSIKRKIAQHEEMQKKMKIASQVFQAATQMFVKIPEKKMPLPNWLIDSHVKGAENKLCQKSHALAVSVQSHSCDTAQGNSISVTLDAKASGKKHNDQSRMIGSDKSTKSKGLIALKLPDWLNEIQSPSGTGSKTSE